MGTSEIFSLSLPTFLRIPIEFLLGIFSLRKIYHASISRNLNIYDAIIDVMNIDVQTNRREMLKIPKSGACMIIANHPYGCVEGIAIMKTLSAFRDDVKIVATRLLDCVPEFSESMIFVDTNESECSRTLNSLALKSSIDWLRSGGMIIVFPAGEVSLYSFKSKSVEDKEWHSTFLSIALKTRATIIPAFIHGSNSAIFQVVGLMNRKLKLLLLINEFLRKRNTSLKISFGKPISDRNILGKSLDEVMDFVRKRVYLLQHKSDEVLTNSDFHLTVGESIAEPVSKHLLQANIDQLDKNILLTHGEFTVYFAQYDELPYCILELGRLRELSFRLAGEGTGKPTDSDIYDMYYVHIFIWDKQKNEIVGAYRIGKTNEILSQHGIEGLYTSTLFDIDNSVAEVLNYSLELGRSFVHPEYQKSYLPLLLLWKGIAAYIAKHPQYRFLFGAVSISSEFTVLSKAIIVHYLQGNYSCTDSCFDAIRGKNTKSLHTMKETYKDFVVKNNPESLEDLHDIVVNLESDGNGLPPLVKHYIKLGGKFAAFSIDSTFNNCIDALVIVDLMDTETTILRKYMSEQTQVYYSYHKDETTNNMN